MSEKHRSRSEIVWAILFFFAVQSNYLHDGAASWGVVNAPFPVIPGCEH